MTTQEIQASSQAKLDKIYAFLKELQVMPDVKRKLMNTGYIEEFVAFIDMEQYPMDTKPEGQEIET